MKSTVRDSILKYVPYNEEEKNKGYFLSLLLLILLMMLHSLMVNEDYLENFKLVFYDSSELVFIKDVK